jgi:uncharacterized protein involved in exopolysaccharide biosynthesis
MEIGNRKQTKISDYLNILYKWKKLLLINMFLIITGATVYSFLIPEQFKANSVVMVTNSQNSGMGGLGALFGGGFGSLGSQLLGMTSPSQDIIIGILASRTSLTNAISRFGLAKYYGVDDNNIDKVLKSFSSDVSFEPTETGMIEISVINESPELSAEIANFFVRIADSLNIALNVEQARNNRLFIEKRYYKNIADLKSAEDSFYTFQKKYKISAVPEQIQVSVQAAAELEAKYIENEIIAEIIKNQYGVDSPNYLSALKQMEFLKNKINELKNAEVLSYTSNILFPFSKIPDITIEYFRVYREIELQSKIMEFILPLYEQAMVDEQKSIPTLIVLDKAVPPELKHSPKKAFIILLLTFLGFFVHLPFIFLGEKLITTNVSLNEIELKTRIFYQKVTKLYRLRV